MSKAELPAEVVEQHIGWLKLYLESMTVDNWQDNKARGLRQLAELSTDARKIIAAERERCAKIAEDKARQSEWARIALDEPRRCPTSCMQQAIAEAIRTSVEG